MAEVEGAVTPAQGVALPTLAVSWQAERGIMTARVLPLPMMERPREVIETNRP